MTRVYFPVALFSWVVMVLLTIFGIILGKQIESHEILLSRQVFGAPLSGNIWYYIGDVDRELLIYLARQPAQPVDLWQPSWSPDGESILYMANREFDSDVFLRSHDGNVVNLTYDPIHQASDLSARWSPDGKSIIYASDRSGYSAYFIMSLEGTTLQQVTTRDMDPVFVSWSPDSESGMFSSISMYLVDFNSGNVDQIIRESASITWSPDARFIVYTTHSSNAILRYDIATGTTITLTDQIGGYIHPMWSPHGEWIAFDSLITGNFDIFVMDMDTYDMRQITFNAERDQLISWSPEGSRILYRSDRQGRTQLYIYDLATAETVSLTEDILHEYRDYTVFTGQWSPDGTQIIFSTVSNSLHGNQLFLINADGTGLHPIFSFPENDRLEIVQWQP